MRRFSLFFAITHYYLFFLVLKLQEAKVHEIKIWYFFPSLSIVLFGS